MVCRLVDERFFRYAADEFIRLHPPEQACLFAYGSRFADFLAEFPPCRELVYLPDVARVEWLMHVASHAAEAAPLSLAALVSVAAADMPNVVFRLHPSIGFLDSRWPVDRIWRANSGGFEGEATINLDVGGVRMEVRRVEEDVVFRQLDPAIYAFAQRSSAVVRSRRRPKPPWRPTQTSTLSPPSATSSTTARSLIFQSGAMQSGRPRDERTRGSRSDLRRRQLGRHGDRRAQPLPASDPAVHLSLQRRRGVLERRADQDRELANHGRSLS